MAKRVTLKKRAARASSTAKTVAPKRIRSARPASAQKGKATRQKRATSKSAPNLQPQPASLRATPAPAVRVAKRAPKRVVVAPPKPVKPAPPLKIDLDGVREKLLAKKTEILDLYRNDLRSGQESNDSPTEDIVDRANNAYSRELSFSISDAERTRLIEVDDALQRLELGAYGRCAHCSEQISEARLTAVPWAKHCVQCQELLEQGMLPEA